MSEGRKYISLRVAMQRLGQRLEDLTKNEIAAFIFFDSIKAYTNVHEPWGPSEFTFNYIGMMDWKAEVGDKDFPPYLDLIEGAYFDEEEIEKFTPAVRYLPFSMLFQRWLPKCEESEKATLAFMRSRVRESRLMDFVPGLGFSNLAEPSSDAPMEWSLFSRAEIDDIEAEDFGVVHPESFPHGPGVTHAHAKADSRKRYEIPDRLEYKARQIGEQWMAAEKKEGRRPGVIQIAKHVEKELNRLLKNPANSMQMV